jgi:type IV pilus assembly protein PilA
MKKWAGFSLIELMVVVAIVGILAVIAIPNYKTYSKRARFTEIISATEPYKIAVALALQTGIPLAEITNGVHNIPDPPSATKNLTAVEVKNGIITATGSALVDSKTYILKPDANGNTWAVEGTCKTAALCDG